MSFSAGVEKYVYVVRHGERYDCIHPEWKATAKRPHDPHLSAAGVKQARTTGQFIAHRTRKERGDEAMADIGIYSSPFLRCVQTAKAISHGYYDELHGKPRVDFDVQVKLENGLAEFLTTLHFTEQLEPLSQVELNRVLEGELDKFYGSAQPFPTFPESVHTLYRRLQASLLAILDTSPHRTVVLVTHGYGVQVLSEYMQPRELVTSTDFACITAARAWRRGGGEVGHAGRLPTEFEHSALVPEPLESEWQFECEQVCDVKHWRPDTDEDTAQAERQNKETLANPLPQQEEVKVRDK